MVAMRYALALLSVIALVLASYLPAAQRWARTNTRKRNEVDETTSAHFCLGEGGATGYFRPEGDDPDWIVRRCVFKNICIDAAQMKIRYFLPSEIGKGVGMDLDHPLRVLQRRNASAPFLMLRSIDRAEAHKLSLELVDGTFDPNSAPRHEIAVYYQPLWLGHNVGHVLLDDAFPMFEMLSNFGLLDPDRTTVFGKHRFNCTETPDLCRKFVAPFWRPITAKPIRYLESGCFKTVLAGSGNATAVHPFGGGSANGRAYLMDKFVESIMRHAGLVLPSPPPDPNRPLVLLVAKQGKRNFSNIDDVHRHLVARGFPTYVGKPEVKITRDLHLLSIAEQFRLLQRTSVLVTPCGGVSMVGHFLPRNAHIVVPDHLEADPNGIRQYVSQHMEHKVWAWQTRVRVVYYHVLGERDVILPDNWREKMLLRDATFVLDPERIWRLVKRALAEQKVVPVGEPSAWAPY